VHGLVILSVTLVFLFGDQLLDGETTFRFDGVGYVAVQVDGDWSLDLE
jgi:hypothetical protein